MKDSHRKFRSCIFCSVELTGGNRTPEHIFGRSIAKLIPAKRNWIGGPTSELTTRGGHQFRWTTSRSVCETCNIGWMRKDLEGAFLTLKALISGQSFEIASANSAPVRRYFERLAFIVDAETSNLDLKLNDDELISYAAKFGKSRLRAPIFSQDERAAFKDGALNNELQIYLGRHNGVFGLDPEFCLTRNPFPGLESKRITTIIGYLAVMMEFKNSPRYLAPKLLHLGDKTGETITFESISPFCYDDFYQMLHQDREVRWRRHLLRNRTNRRKMESEYRRKGEWQVPPIPSDFN